MIDELIDPWLLWTLVGAVVFIAIFGYNIDYLRRKGSERRRERK